MSVDNAGSCFQLNIPVAIVQNCQDLKSGQMVKLGGSNQKQGSKDADDFNVYAQKNGEWLSFSFHSKNTGTMFESKLSDLWKCHILCIELATTMKRSSACTTPKPSYTSDVGDSPKRIGLAHDIKKEPIDTEDADKHQSPSKVPYKVSSTEKTKSNESDDDGDDGTFDVGAEMFDDGDSESANDEDCNARNTSRRADCSSDSKSENRVANLDDAKTLRSGRKRQKITYKRWATKGKDVKDLACTFCERKWFLSVRAYHRHLNSCSKNPANIKQETEEEKKIRLMYTCHICQMACGKHRLKRHLQLAHKVLVKKKKPREPNLENRCKFCDMTFTSHSTLNRHRKFKCILNPDVLIGGCKACKYCGSQFEKKDLARHIQKNHPGGQKYICDICGKIFPSRSGLYTHKKRHMDDAISKKFVCPVCGKRHAFKYQHEEHVTMHSDVRSVICELCGKAFKTRKALLKHIDAFHHNKYRYHCDECGHGMAKKEYLKSHKCSRVRRVQVKNDPNMENTLNNISQLQDWTTEGRIANYSELNTPNTVLSFTNQEFTVEMAESASDLFGSTLVNQQGNIEVSIDPSLVPKNADVSATEEENAVPRKFPCDLCSSSFNYKHHLVRHKRTIHEGRYSFHCDHCGHGFEEKRTLMSHKCGEKP